MQDKVTCLALCASQVTCISHRLITMTGSSRLTLKAKGKRGGIRLILPFEGLGKNSHIRIGSTSRLATREQQMRLFELGGMLHTELMPVPRADKNSLDIVRLENYFRDIIKDPEIPQTPEEWENLLLGMGFLA